MIGEPLALSIRRRIQRPAPQVLRAFRGAPSGFVTDAFNGRGCLDFRIKPLTPDMTLCGSAVTALCSPGDILAAMAILDFVRKGDVIVIATGVTPSRRRSATSGCTRRGSAASREWSATAWSAT